MPICNDFEISQGISTVVTGFCFLVLSFSRLLQFTGTGAHGTCGASAQSSAALVRGNACANVTTRRPNLEEKAAWAQTDKPCLVVCQIARVSPVILK